MKLRMLVVAFLLVATAVPALALGRPNAADNRLAIVNTLGGIRDRRAVDAVAQALLTDESIFVRLAAAKALGEIRDARAVDPLLRALADPKWEVRAAAAEALAAIGDAKAVDGLIAALRDEDATVRANTAAALGALKAARAVEGLALLLRTDVEVPVREQAALALGKIGGSPAADALLEALRDREGRVRIAAVTSLALLKETRAHEPLVGMFVNDDVEAVRTRVGAALVELKGQKIVDLLIEKLRAAR